MFSHKSRDTAHVTFAFYIQEHEAAKVCIVLCTTAAISKYQYAKEQAIHCNMSGSIFLAEALLEVVPDLNGDPIPRGIWGKAFHGCVLNQK